MPSSSRTETPLDPAETVELSANRTVVLDDPRRALVVVEGSVLVFAVELIEGEPIGRRHLLCTLSEGDGAFGLARGHRARMGLLATGIGSAQVRELVVGAEDVDSHQLHHAAARWSALVAERLARHKLPSGLSTLPDVPVIDLGPGEAVAPAEGCVWVRVAEGAVLAAGVEETLTSPGDPPVPLPDTAWVAPLDTARIEVSPWSEGFAGADGWAGIERFTVAAMDVMWREAAVELDARASSARQALWRDARLTEIAIADLAEALPSRRRVVTRPVDDPLKAAVRAVEEHLGVIRGEEELDEPAPSPSLPVDADGADGPGVPSSETLRLAEEAQAQVIAYSTILARTRRLASRSGCRARRATLPSRWWEKDAGPLVAFRESDWSPLALLPNGRHYEVVDPVAGQSHRADEALDAELRPEAVALSRGLGAELHRAGSLLANSVKGSGADLTKVALFGSLAGLASLVVPLATGLVFNSIVPNSERHRLVVLIAVLVMVAVGVAVGSLARGVAFFRAQARSTATAQMSVWDRLLRLPASFFGSYAVGELMTRTQSVQLSQQIMSDAVVANLLNGIFGIFNVILLIKGGTTLFFVGLGLLLLQFLVVIWANLVASTPNVTRQLNAENRVQALTLQLVRGMNKLRVAAAESRAFAVWAKRFAAQQRATYRQGKLQAFSGVFTVAFPTLTSLAIIGGVLMTGRNGIQLGNYVAYTTAFTQASTALVTIGIGLGVMSTGISYLEQVHPILEAEPEVGTGQEDPGELRGKVIASKVAFRYDPDGPLVLKGVTIRINPGEFVAIVGPSGAGKSSIIRLLLGFDRPESGVVAYDDRDLALLDVTAVRRQIGSVIQGARLLPGTVFSNIAGGLPITRDDAWDAAKAAGVDNDIAEMPMGMETVVQEGGGTLSGGQSQRILIARALALKPKILLFDEATSALDNITQAQVTESVNKLQVTRIVIAHRLSTIKDADRIYVLVAGQVAQEGTYEELMAVQGPFRDLAARQIT